jgi:hypothetical protein
MATLALLGLVSLDTGAGVHGDLTSHDKTILEELSDVLACSLKLDLIRDSYGSWQGQLRWFRWDQSKRAFDRT